LKVGEASVRVTISDVATITIFVTAKEMGVPNLEAYSADDVTKDKALIARCKELRGKAAQLIGMCDNWDLVDQQSIGIPSLVLIAPRSGPPETHITSRFILNNMCHDSMAGTIATCTAATSRIAGTIVNEVVGENALKENVFKIHHPLGVMPVQVEAVVNGEKSLTVSLDNPTFSVLAFVRTSRRIMDGYVYLPQDVWDGTVTHHETEDVAHRASQ
jgi:2-methylaconitate isomerase